MFEIKTAKSWQNGCRLAGCGAARAGVAVAAMLLSGQGSAGVDTYDGGADSKSQTLQGGGGGNVYLRGSGRDAVNEVDYDIAGDFYREKSAFYGKMVDNAFFSVLYYCHAH